MHDLELRHYGKAPVKLDRSREYNLDGGWNHKPRGIWFTPAKGPDTWPKYWRENMGRESSRIAVEHEVTLAPNANILWIRNYEEFDAFHEEYKTGLSYDSSRLEYIDWRRVSDKYDGIIIIPYLWGRRMGGINWGDPSNPGPEQMWYYSWDVASGCIWNLRAIQSIRWLYPPIVELEARTAQWIDIAFERALNRLKYGTDDPTGGHGRQLYPIAHPLDPSFQKPKKKSKKKGKKK